MCSGGLLCKGAIFFAKMCKSCGANTNNVLPKATEWECTHNKTAHQPQLKESSLVHSHLPIMLRHTPPN